jgi:hypothetical protein
VEVNGRDAIYKLQQRLWQFNLDNNVIALLQETLDVMSLIYDELEAEREKKGK